MATSTSLLLLLLLLLNQPWAGSSTETQMVVCAGTACYTAHWGKLSAAQAQLHCSKNGGNLATVRTEEEAQHIQRALAQLLQPGMPLATRVGKFWIGLQREKGKCLNRSLPLKGFSWVGGGEDTPYANWHKEARNSCISRRCVSLMLDLSLPPLISRLPKWSEGPCGSPGSPGSNIEGFVCKFSFKGMCRPLALGGPGQVNYTTPFQATSSSLEAVPFGSIANVACEGGGKSGQHFFLCKEKATDVFNWGSSGPLCVSPEYGCNFNNGGCQQDCFEGGDGSFRCGCRPGFRLLDDLVTCTSRNACSSSPCGGVATCVPGPLWKSYTCLCPQGYQLDSTQRDCVDVDECQDSPCAQECINTPGGFHCQCWVGYESSGPGERACQDVDECETDHSPCTQGCTNTDGSFYCFCKDGYVLTGEDGTQCQDVDECEGPERSLCDSLCFNMQGSFRCSCLPGWELAPDGVSCIMGPTSLGRSAGSLQGENTGAREGKIEPPATMPSPTGDPKGTSKVVPTMRRPSLPRNASITPAPPKTLTPSRLPGIWIEPSNHHPTTTTGHEESTGGDFMVQQRDDDTDRKKLLLFYILGTVMAILLLLALALGLLVYRKHRAKREKEKKPQSTADSYSWVPERTEGRAMENQYSPTPGMDC
ncbi:PREDICTED: complement component C1q receptor [Hipposideros armiger]|uniref:Complement component C1q receptor n=1 Tax=Hipposideros armiger TaxID=186990 RepID=A0A8B7SGL4_HIPAR|nr:PREDICTED: complement component C1q receptor [Hipposideros armiger]